jgi:ABC-type transport system substrate-binding protein
MGSDPDNSSEWLCSMIPPNGNNINRYCSPAMDAAQRTALSTFDRSARRAAYAKIEQLLLQDVPAVFFYDQSMRYAHTPSLTGFAPNGVTEGWNANQWSR